MGLEKFISQKDLFSTTTTHYVILRGHFKYTLDSEVLAMLMGEPGYDQVEGLQTAKFSEKGISESCAKKQ